MRELRGKTAIVTGASRGIGRQVALRLAREGIAVTAVARSEALLAALARSALPPGSAEITAHACDVRDEAAVVRVVAAHVARVGRLDVLVNNAGVGVFKPLEDTSYAEFSSTIEVNAGGTFLFTKAALPHMKRQGDGDIINVASVVAVKGYANQCAYGASKHAVLGLTKALAVEAQPHGVRVRSICPGGVDTELLAAARPDLDRSGLIRPEDIAELVVFLLRMADTAVVDNINVRRRNGEPWF
jgi:3-oxoacyl-[acyl-carrier protein] reductase